MIALVLLNKNILVYNNRKNLLVILLDSTPHLSVLAVELFSNANFVSAEDLKLHGTVAFPPL